MDHLPLAPLALGFLLGSRHACDPDHVLAVTTIVTNQRSLRRSSIVGTLWGMGHAAAVLGVGVIVLGFELRIPPQLTLLAEGGVGIMLVVLGVNALRRAMAGWQLHAHVHSHGGWPHVHFHVHSADATDTHDHTHLLAFGAPPFLVGMVHGLAGSASLMLVVLATLRSRIDGIVYIMMFGLGSIAAMLVLSSLISLPFLLSGPNVKRLHWGAQLVAGLGSVLFGTLFAGRALF